MEKTSRDVTLSILSAVVLLFAVVLFVQTVTPVQAFAAKAPVVKQSGSFDTSIIEDNWYGDFSDGTIRMVRAWQYERQLVEDETGDVWYIEEVAVQADDCLLLWVADNHTPNDTMDDIIVKVWREAY